MTLLEELFLHNVQRGMHPKTAAEKAYDALYEIQQVALKRLNLTTGFVKPPSDSTNPPPSK